jgi:hypothetical protein
MNSVNVVVLIVAIVAIAIAGWALFQRQKTLKLKRQFGPEYNRVIDQEKMRDEPKLCSETVKNGSTNTPFVF